MLLFINGFIDVILGLLVTMLIMYNSDQRKQIVKMIKNRLVKK